MNNPVNKYQGIETQDANSCEIAIKEASNNPQKKDYYLSKINIS